MARPKKPREEVMLDVPCKVPPEVLRELEGMALALERSKSFISRKLLLCGLEYYRLTNSLEPEGIKEIIERAKEADADIPQKEFTYPDGRKITLPLDISYGTDES